MENPIEIKPTPENPERLEINAFFQEIITMAKENKKIAEERWKELSGESSEWDLELSSQFWNVWSKYDSEKLKNKLPLLWSIAMESYKKFAEDRWGNAEEWEMSEEDQFMHLIEKLEEDFRTRLEKIMSESNSIETSGLNNLPEKEDKRDAREVCYDDLIAMYYYEALSHQNPFYEKHLERVTQKLKDNLMLYTKEYIRNYSTDASVQTSEGALYDYFKDFRRDLESEHDPKMLCQLINSFIMYVHERLKLNLGEELLGVSADDLKALNYIDTNKPLGEQSRIIWDKMSEENEKYEK